MFDEKQKSCVNLIHLVTDVGLYDQKAFHTVKIVFHSSSITTKDLEYVKINSVNSLTLFFSKVNE